MSEEKQERFERKKKRYRAVYKRETPYRKTPFLQEASAFHKKRVRKKKKE